MRRSLEEKEEKVYNIFSNDLKWVNKTMHERKLFSLSHVSKTAGYALWSKVLRKRIDSLMEVRLLLLVCLRIRVYKVFNLPLLPSGRSDARCSQP